ncbi:MAG: sugar ABC transporter ATP-binding protein [Gammaproteobacteria bacterium]|nr:sugar ABC transporter ATP-binding protein [Gammaproteobacteria bacterium]
MAANDNRAAGAGPVLEALAVTKEYAGARALDGVDFELRGGEVHVLFGENGAGKSTLISILAGARRPSAGRIRFRGRTVRLDSVHAARRLGIRAVFQEFSLVPQMSVEENLFLGAEKTRAGLLHKQALRRQAQALLDRLHFDIDAARRVETLSRAEQQMVEIAKAFGEAPAVLILDEPTASLTDNETGILFGLIGELKASGVGVIYITHRMGEIRRIGDRVTVLRDGRYVATVGAATADEELVRLMTGRAISEIFPAIESAPGEVALAVDQVTTASGGVRGASFHARRGEIVGLAGLVGCGKSEVARAIYGLEKIRAGQVRLHGENVNGLRPAKMLRRGLFYSPPDRREEGLVMMRSCHENIALPALGGAGFSSRGFLNHRRGAATTRRLAEKFRLSPMRMNRAVEFFSGGNQQKVMLAKCQARAAEAFIFDEPTVGVDVGTRSEIYRFMKELCDAGAAVVLVSSDLPEILNLAHRVYVFCAGEVRAELAGPAITEDRVLANFFHRESA